MGGSGRPAEGTAQAPIAALVATSIRRERERAGLSMTELARRAGLAKSTLSQLESGTGNPSVETLWALAVGLGVPFSRLVDMPRPATRVVRAGEGPVIASEQASYRASLLASSPPNARRDIYRIQAQPGEPRQSQPHLPGTIEHVVMSCGRARIGPVTQPAELGPGDYICYPGDEPHVFLALEPGTSAVMIMEHV